MDNITHTLTAVMLSRAGLNRFTPRASAILFLAANAPDLDVLSVFGGAETYFRYHRWITHALVTLPFLALLPVLVVALVSRLFSRWLPSAAPIRPRNAYLISLVGVASHLLLDFTNQYGIRLFLPFSDAWPGLAITNVVDIWIWAVLLLAVLAPLLSRLVSSEMGGRHSSGRGWAIFALITILLYDTTRFVLHQRAINVQEARLFNGAIPRYVGAFPGAWNPLRWRGVVYAGNAFYISDFTLAGEFDPSAARVFYTPEPSPVIETANRLPLFEYLRRFSPAVLDQIGPIPTPDGGTDVSATDLRFSSPQVKRFTAHALIDDKGTVRRSWFQF